MTTSENVVDEKTVGDESAASTAITNVLELGYAVGSKETAYVVTEEDLQETINDILTEFVRELETRIDDPSIRYGGINFVITEKIWKEDQQRLARQRQITETLMKEKIGIPTSLSITFQSPKIKNSKRKNRTKKPDTTVTISSTCSRYDRSSSKKKQVRDDKKHRLYYEITSKCQESYGEIKECLERAIKNYTEIKKRKFTAATWGHSDLKTYLSHRFLTKQLFGKSFTTEFLNFLTHEFWCKLLVKKASAFLEELSDRFPTMRETEKVPPGVKLAADECVVEVPIPRLFSLRGYAEKYTEGTFRLKFSARSKDKFSILVGKSLCAMVLIDTKTVNVKVLSDEKKIIEKYSRFFVYNLPNDEGKFLHLALIQRLWAIHESGQDIEPVTLDYRNLIAPAKKRLPQDETIEPSLTQSPLSTNDPRQENRGEDPYEKLEDEIAEEMAEDERRDWESQFDGKKVAIEDQNIEEDEEVIPSSKLSDGQQHRPEPLIETMKKKEAAGSREIFLSPRSYTVGEIVEEGKGEVTLSFGISVKDDISLNEFAKWCGKTVDELSEWAAQYQTSVIFAIGTKV